MWIDGVGEEFFGRWTPSTFLPFVLRRTGFLANYGHDVVYGLYMD